MTSENRAGFKYWTLVVYAGAVVLPVLLGMLFISVCASRKEAAPKQKQK